MCRLSRVSAVGRVHVYLEAAHAQVPVLSQRDYNSSMLAIWLLHYAGEQCLCQCSGRITSMPGSKGGTSVQKRSCHICLASSRSCSCSQLATFSSARGSCCNSRRLIAQLPTQQALPDIVWCFKASSSATAQCSTCKPHGWLCCAFSEPRHGRSADSTARLVHAT